MGRLVGRGTLDQACEETLQEKRGDERACENVKEGATEPGSVMHIERHQGIVAPPENALDLFLLRGRRDPAHQTPGRLQIGIDRRCCIQFIESVCPAAGIFKGQFRKFPSLTVSNSYCRDEDVNRAR